MKKYLLIFSLLFSTISFAADGAWKFRAREHFEVHDIDTGVQSFDYKGLSNTINFWYEKPMEYSIGFSFSPLLGRAEFDGDGAFPALLGDKVVLRTIGGEAKYFFLGKDSMFNHLFTRVGLGLTQLNTDGTVGNVDGWSWYLGFGWEFMWGNVGIVPEFAIRQSDLSDGVDVMSITPSIAFHFYNFSLF